MSEIRISTTVLKRIDEAVDSNPRFTTRQEVIREAIRDFIKERSKPLNR